MGEIYLAKKDLPSARKYFEKANQINPNDPLAANDLAWVYALQGENLDVADDSAARLLCLGLEQPSLD